MTPPQLRVVGATGVLATLCFVVGFVLDPTPPTAGSSATAVLAHEAFAAQDRAAAMMFALSGALLIPFAAGLRSWFGDISSAPRWWGTVLLAAGVATGTLLIGASALFFTVASHPISDPELATLVTDGVNYAFVFAG